MSADAGRDPAASLDIGGLLDRAVRNGTPGLRAVLTRIGETGGQALDAAAIDVICDHLHPLLPLPVRMVVGKARLAVFVAANRDLVLAAARRAGQAG